MRYPSTLVDGDTIHPAGEKSLLSGQLNNKVPLQVPSLNRNSPAPPSVTRWKAAAVPPLSLARSFRVERYSLATPLIIDHQSSLAITI